MSRLRSTCLTMVRSGLISRTRALWTLRSISAVSQNSSGRSLLSPRAPNPISPQPYRSKVDIAANLLLFDYKDGVATITLKDDKKRNALSSTMMGELKSALETLETDKSVKVVVLRHDGKVFSSGHDLKELATRQSTLGTTDPVFSLCTELMLTIKRVRFPVIAEVGGLATAGGCQLVAACDLAVASDTATFSTPGVKIGLFCTTPSVELGRVMPMKQAMEMLLTGDAMTAAQAVACGLINKAVSADRLREATTELADKIAQAPSDTIAVGKRAFYKHMAMSDVTKAYDFAQGVMVANMGAPDCEEGIDAFISKRKPEWKS